MKSLSTFLGSRTADRPDKDEWFISFLTEGSDHVLVKGSGHISFMDG